ncbi:MAG TPA: RNA pyrophosphohydrolase [Ilumatobacteraceae bacterium]|nr:RNA pyrophosphohydrolase [Ilumatobacteraceae bacterium]
MPSSNFRAGVVAVVTNSLGEILAFERSDVPGAWQLPQGGIDVGESPLESAWRELGEETGLGPDQVDLVGEHPDWVVYEFPEAVRGVGKRLGQAQRWYLFRVRSDDVSPAPDEVEFVAWKWVEPTWLLDHVVDFRLAAYRSVIPRLVP